MSNDNKMSETDIIMNTMVDIIDKLEALPEECPEIKESKTFQWMTEQSEKLSDYMRKRTQEMLDMVDHVELSRGFATIFNNSTNESNN